MVLTCETVTWRSVWVEVLDVLACATSLTTVALVVAGTIWFDAIAHPPIVTPNAATAMPIFANDASLLTFAGLLTASAGADFGAGARAGAGAREGIGARCGTFLFCSPL